MHQAHTTKTNIIIGPSHYYQVECMFLMKIKIYDNRHDAISEHERVFYIKYNGQLYLLAGWKK